MDDMLVNPRPGTTPEQLQKILQEQHGAVSGLSTGHQGSAQDKLGAYLEWTANAVRQLARPISPADLDRLVLTPGYGRLLAAFGTVTGTDNATQRALNDLVSLELQLRENDFETARRALDVQIARWSRDGAFMVADTSVYIEHKHKLEELDVAALLPPGNFQPIHLLVPIVVVDELNGLKDKAPRPLAKWRAGHTLGVFDKLFANGTGPAALMPSHFEISAEMVFDPPGHVRLPINDDELVDRTLAIQALAGRPVTLVTFDTNQSTRARAAGLTVNKLTKPIGDEPSEKARPRRAQPTPQ